jgi:hypothetical protein
MFRVAFPDAFGLITLDGQNILFSIFALASSVLVMETLGCDWFMENVSLNYPYHLLFDLLFWQVLGSAVDVIIMSPKNGHFVLEDTQN